MAADDLHAELDWSTATVQGGRLTVGYDAKASSEWSDRVQAVLDRLGRSDGRWGKIKVRRKRVRVTCVEPGCEDDLRLLLEGAVHQANTDFADDEPDGDGTAEPRSRADAEMTATFRSFAPDG